MRQVYGTAGIRYCYYHLVTNIGYCDYLPAVIWISDRANLIASFQISGIVTILALSQGSHNIRYLLYRTIGFRAFSPSLSTPSTMNGVPSHCQGHRSARKVGVEERQE